MAVGRLRRVFWGGGTTGKIRVLWSRPSFPPSLDPIAARDPRAAHRRARNTIPGAISWPAPPHTRAERAHSKPRGVFSFGDCKNPDSLVGLHNPDPSRLKGC